MLDWQVESRERLGVAIAAFCKIKKKARNVWLVPARSRPGRYTVRIDPSSPHCTCPDHEETGERCKHIFAVEYLSHREENPDGTTMVTEALTVTKEIPETYPQDWPAYNAAQVNEKRKFLQLLADLCRTVVHPGDHLMGRPRLPLRDVAFMTTYKVYSTFSQRRFMSDLAEAHIAGHISAIPHFNSISNYLAWDPLTPVLTDLIIRASLPFAEIERRFAADSTGFTSRFYTRWFDIRHRQGARGEEHNWAKAHIMAGVDNHVITAIKILDRDASDTKILPNLLDETVKHFPVDEVYADKGYSSVRNHEVIAAAGADPYIMFKVNAKGARQSPVWQRSFLCYSQEREKFLQHYHQRSNVETVMSMMKAKFGGAVRSRGETAMRNEVLCKALAHNICRLVHAIYELDLDVNAFLRSPR